MANLKQKLKGIEDQLEQLDEQIQSHCIAWAQEYTAGLSRKECPEEIGKLLEDIERIDRDYAAIDSLAREIEEIRSAQTKIRESESEEIKARADFYLILGRRAFDLYKKGALSETEGLDGIFEPLLNWEDKIRNADNELFRIRSEEGEKSFFRKMGTFIKKSSQSSIKKSAGDNLNKYYKKAGERLINDGYFNAIAQNGLTDIYEEFQSKNETSRKLREELESLSMSEKEREQKIAELCRGNKPAKALKVLEDEKGERDGELDKAYLRLGQSLYSGEEEGKPFRGLVDELKKEREEKSREKVLCVTGIRIEELDEQLQKKRKEADQQKEKAEKERLKWEALEGEAEELLVKKTQLESEKAELGPDRSEED